MSLRETMDRAHGAAMAIKEAMQVQVAIGGDLPTVSVGALMAMVTPLICFSDMSRETWMQMCGDVWDEMEQSFSGTPKDKSLVKVDNVQETDGSLN